MPAASDRRAVCGQVAAAARVLAWGAAWLVGVAGAALATNEVEFIGVTDEVSRAEVRILSSGRPEVIGSQLDRDGVLVVELADHRPAAGLAAVRQEAGLVAAVDVGLHEGDGGVSTRIMIRTRGRAVHTISFEGPLIQVALQRAAGESVGKQPETRPLEERIHTTGENLAESERSRAVLVGQIETMSKANRQFVQLFEELENRRGQLEKGLESARSELIRLREERAARDDESSRRLEELGQREQELIARVARLTGEVAEAEGTQSELTRRLQEAAIERGGLESRLQVVTAQEEALEQRVEELAAQVAESQGSESELTRRLREASIERDELAARVAAVSAERRELEVRSGALEAESRELASSLERAKGEIVRYRSSGLLRGRTTANVNLRAGAGIDFEQLTLLPAETVAEVLSRGEEWLQVRVGEREGWVAAEYFALEEDELSEMRARAAELEAELTRNRGESGTLRERLAQVDAERQELAGERETLVSELSAARDEVARLAAESADRSGELSGRLQAAETREADLERQMEELTARITESQGSESELTRRLQEAVGEQSRMADRLLQAAAREEDLVRRMEGLATEVAETRSAEAELANRLQATDAARAELEARLVEAADRDRALEARVVELAAELETAKGVETELDRRLEEGGAGRADLEARLESVTAARAALAAEVEVLGSERERLAAELATSRREVGRYREQGLLRGRATANVNLRSGPGIDFERLALLPAETVAEVLSRGDGWVEVRAAGRPGWVSSDYFRLEGDELTDLGRQLADLGGALSRSQVESEALTERLARVTAERDTLAAEVDGSQGALARAEAESGARIEDLTERLEVAEGRELDLERRVEELGNEMAAARAAGERLASSLEDTDAARSDLVGRLETVAAEKATLEEQVSSLRARNQALSAELEAAAGTVESYREQGLVRAHTTAGVNLRSGPGIDFERLALLPVETVAEVLNRGEGWLRVRAAGLVGWVSGDYLRLENDELSALRGSVAELTAKVVGMEQAGQQLLVQLEVAQDDRADLEERLERARQEEQTLAARVGELDRRLAAAASEGRSLGQSVARTEDEKSRLAARLESVSGERAELGAQVELLAAERTALTAHVKQLSGELETTRRALDRMTEVADRAPSGGTAQPSLARGPRAAVEAWAAAWSNRNVDRYLSFYAREFQPRDGSSRGDWEARRRARLARPAWIRVGLGDLEVSGLAPGRAAVSFIQNYESDLFQDRVPKLLELVSEDGRWKIVRELVR